MTRGRGYRGLYSKTACSPFFGCHFRSKKQFKKNFWKKSIFGGLPVKKQILASGPKFQQKIAPWVKEKPQNSLKN